MTHRILTILAGLFLSACTSIAPVPQQDRDVVKVMVLGTYHFSNPGLDIVNTKADDVLTPRRQTELDRLVEQLSAFHPTAIAVESTRRDEGLFDTAYREFAPADLTTDRNETVQIGYRLASRLGLDRVYAVDEYEGEIDFFPFDRVQALAERTGQEDRIATLIAEVQTEAAEIEAAQVDESISQLLARYNTPGTIRTQHDNFYYGLMNMSEGDDHAGAVLNYGWYARNALIFSNLARVARPGDRIIVLYGAGHAYWLRHFAEETPGYALEEALPHLTDQASNGS